MKREKKRDDRNYDTTSLHGGLHEKTLNRDYSAHFFRWSFARNMIGKTDKVLDVGCGPGTPLKNMLFHGPAPLCSEYVGVDINKLPSTKMVKAHYYGEFNFVERWKELLKAHGQFDTIVHLEVIEHMMPAHGEAMLKAMRKLLKPGGRMLMSTPCYDGKRHAANHIHEYTVTELDAVTRKAGFKVERRFGTFIDLIDVKKAIKAMEVDANTASAFGLAPPKAEGSRIEFDKGGGMRALAQGLRVVHAALGDYYDRDALSCFLAPLFPDLARNNLWVCT